ncbi:glycosyltransferase [soil metagenome]
MPVPRQGNPYQHQLASGLSRHGVRVRMARGYMQPFPFLQAVMRRPRPSVFHLHWTQPYLYWPRTGRMSRLLGWRLLVQVRLLRRLGIRIVWTVHNMAAHERDDIGAELGVSRRLAGLCDALIVHCEAARQLVIETLAIPVERQPSVVVVPHGNYIEAYPQTTSRQAARASFGFSDEQRVLLLMGSLRAYKGTTDLLDAFAAIDGPDVRLLIAGKPFTTELSEEIGRLVAADPRVTARLEFVPTDEIERYLLAADAAVAPFRDVLTSGTVVLAMSFGLAVVAPRLGCLPETVDDAGGVLYDAQAEHGLATAVRQTLASDLRAMGAHNRARMEPLDWAFVAEQTLALAYGGRPSDQPVGATR